MFEWFHINLTVMKLRELLRWLYIFWLYYDNNKAEISETAKRTLERAKHRIRCLIPMVPDFIQRHRDKGDMDLST